MRKMFSVIITDAQNPEELIRAKFNSYKISRENPKTFLRRVISL